MSSTPKTWTALAASLLACTQQTSKAPDEHDKAAPALEACPDFEPDLSPERWDEPSWGLHWFGRCNRSAPWDAGGEAYFDPTRPTLIYVHGWQKDTTPRRFVETFNYDHNLGELDDAFRGVAEVDELASHHSLADAWIDAGWNVGVFYWNQLADELHVELAEAKIWSAEGPRGMRWRLPNGRYTTRDAPEASVGQLFFEEYAAAMRGYRGAEVRIAGHSLGNQLAIRLASFACDAVEDGRMPENLLPRRLALLDPYWSPGEKEYLGGGWTGERVRAVAYRLQRKGVLLAQYRTSPINAAGVWAGRADPNRILQDISAFVHVRPWYANSLSIPDRVAAKHILAPSWYLASFAYPESLGAATSADELRSMVGYDHEWVQTRGTHSPGLGDDRYERRPRPKRRFHTPLLSASRVSGTRFRFAVETPRQTWHVQYWVDGHLIAEKSRGIHPLFNFVVPDRFRVSYDFVEEGVGRDVVAVALNAEREAIGVSDNLLDVRSEGPLVFVREVGDLQYEFRLLDPDPGTNHLAIDWEHYMDGEEGRAAVYETLGAADAHSLKVDFRWRDLASYAGDLIHTPTFHIRAFRGTRSGLGTPLREFQRAFLISR